MWEKTYVFCFLASLQLATISFHVCIFQGLANYGLWVKLGWLHLFVNKLLGANMKSLGYIECGCANDDEEEQPLEKEEINLIVYFI